ncbi:MAG: SpoIIE family protein phosphatase [Spirochaetota bacterium]|nr:MAG: SpoIIE family protein phosphatase [Spirochaetota bacterium]
MNTNRFKRLTVIAESNNLNRIRDFAIKSGQKLGLNARQLNGLKLSIDEICTNIIRYAYKGMDNGDIRIEMLRSNNKVVTKIIDNGVSFDYKDVVDPDIDRYVREGKKGGFGIYLVRRLNDDVKYARVDNKNILTITNNVEPRPTVIEHIKQNFQPKKMTIKVRFAVISTLIITVISVGTFFLASLTQKRALTRQYINNYVAILKNFAATSTEYILSERTLLITEQIYELIEEEPTIVRLVVIDRNSSIIADKVVQNIGKQYSPPGEIVPLIDQEYLVQEYEDAKYGASLYYSVPIRIAGAYIGKAFLAIQKEGMETVIASRVKRVRILLFMILFWFVGIVGISFMGNIFITPVKKITEEIDRVGKEGLKGGFHFSGYGEFADISNAFNRMMKDLKKSEEELTDKARLKREMQLAQSIQQTLLPKHVPETEGFEISAKYGAAMEVGGDYYDFFYVDENTIGLTVGDVSGKGIGGAFMMSITRTALRLEARRQKDASEVLIRLNDILYSEFKKGMYITLFYIILDSKRRVINYASAGHTPLILYRAETDQTYKLNPRGFPIGLNVGDLKLFKKGITNERLSLNKGDLLLVYTDGITEAMNSKREEYGEQRLLKMIKRYKRLSTSKFADKLIEDIREFTGGIPQSDDFTFIVIRNKEKYDELWYQKRTMLFDLVENEGYTVAKACHEVGISKSSYYRLKRLRDEYGHGALVLHEKKREIQVVDLNISKKILSVVVKHPEYTVKKIGEVLASRKRGGIDIDPTLIYRELKRLKLSTKEKRIAYTKRKKIQEQST